MLSPEKLSSQNSQDENQELRDLLEAVSLLPKKEDKTISFYDFDGTLEDDSVRFKVDPNLLKFRWNTAYPYIEKKYGKETFPKWFRWSEDPKWYRRFVSMMNLKSYQLHMEREYAFDIDNPDHIILTAGDYDFQKEKITQSWFGNAPRIIVDDAKKKPIRMLEKFLELGYVPGKIRFYDDRITNFLPQAKIMGKSLGVDMEFYMAVQSHGKRLLKKIDGTTESKRTVSMRLAYSSKISVLLDS